MEKIDPVLWKKINANGNDSFNVLICTPIDVTLDESYKLSELMAGIYSGSLKGNTIKELSESKDILSIEFDGEVSIM